MTTERTQQHLYELNTESRLTKLESTNEAILKALVDIKTDISNIDKKFESKFDKMDNKIEKTLSDIKADINKMDVKFESKFDKLDNRIWQLFIWTGAGFTGILAIMARGFNWF